MTIIPRHTRRSMALAAALILLVSCQSNDIPPTVACSPLTLADPVAGWRFQVDRADAGRAAGWYAPGFDDSGWRTDILPGKPWEQQGLDYDGVGWFRARVALPGQTPLLMAVSGIDDVATLWIDGQDAGNLSGDLRLVDLSRYAGQSVSLAIRVLDSGGYGGIKDPLRIGGSPEQVLTPGQWAGWLASQHPDWPLPAWTHGGPAAWTMTGGLNAADESLVNSEGAIAPWAAAPTAQAFLVDAASGKLAPNPNPPAFGLVNDTLPLPRWELVNGGATVSNTLFFDETDHALRWLIHVDNTKTNVPFRLLIAVTPLAANQTTHPIHSISALNGSRVWVNGQPFLEAATPPRAVGVGRLADVLAGPLPTAVTLGCAPAGDGAALLEYAISSGQSRSLEFAFPAQPGADFPPAADANARLADATRLWTEQTDRLKLSLPDGRVQGGFQASTGYLLLALDPDGPHPGPLAHDALWTRDAAYIGLALLQTGHADAVRAYLPAIWAGQSAEGRVPPISGAAIPWNDDEWDAQGEAIFLTTATARYTGDNALLGQYYPRIKLAAQFIKALRARNTSTGPARGLLPPSLSAEDLGPNGNHYYWDDLWAVTGLEEAAYAAQTLDQPDDAARMLSEATSLRGAITDSIRAVMGTDPPYIPGSVEERGSSAAARGSVPALWPDPVLSPDDPLVVRAFDYYHQTWINPYQGGFLHRDGQFWPVGGLELAHAYFMLGRGDVLHQILGWTLSHQTLPGTYAWADEVSPNTNGISGGDMPHAWVAASYVTLVRELLISEQGAAIHLFNLAPDGWFEAGRVISVSDAPTEYGPLSLATQSTIQSQDNHWSGMLTLSLSGAKPPSGFVWVLPHEPSSVDGPPGTTRQGTTLIIPPGGGVVKLTFR